MAMRAARVLFPWVLKLPWRLLVGREEAAGCHAADACDSMLTVVAQVGLSGASQIRPRLPKI